MQLYLIVPPTPDDATGATLRQLCDTGNLSAILLQKGEMDDATYSTWAKSQIPFIQKAQIAALLDNTPDLVGKLNADGVHLTQSAEEIGRWSKKLKPESIIGAGGIFSRHDAMTKGEKDVDYVFFGHLDPQKELGEDELIEMSNWWAETFEVPTVSFVTSSGALASQVEFLAIRDQIFAADDPVATLQKLATDLDLQ